MAPPAVTREGVAGVEGDSASAVAGYLDGSAGVVALGGVCDALDHAPAGIGAVIGDQRTIVGDASASGCGRRRSVRVTDVVGRHLVQVFHGFEVLAVAACVGDPHADAVSEVLFERHVPLLYRGVFVMDGEGVIEACGSGGTTGACVERVGEG